MSQSHDDPRRGPHLDLVGIGKSYGPLRALDAVDLRIERGSVHALVGENGAGKSTLGKIISGSISPDDGTLALAGQQVSFTSPRRALQHGVAAMAQELAVVSSLSVAQNVYLGIEPRRLGFVRRRELRRRYRALAASAGFELSADQPVAGLRTAHKQQVEILRALARDAELIVMDEPTAALSAPEIAKLHATVRRLTASGTTVVLVSHFLDEVLALADTVTVLRDGVVVRTAPAAQETKTSLIQAMLGRPLSAAYPEARPPAADAPVVLRVDDLHARGVDGVSLEVRAGEIVALAGLVGSGRTELVRAISGADPRRSGSVSIDGCRPRASAAAGLDAGIVMIAESRKEQGLLLRRPVSENVSLASLRSVSTAGVVRRSRERAAVGELLERVSVRKGTERLTSDALSGGNQQKLLFARALMREPRVLIADEPTRGVDVGSKRAIYDLMTQLADDGAAVLFVSSELEEVLGLAHRVLVMRRGVIAAELSGDALTDSAVLSAAFTDTEPATEHA